MAEISKEQIRPRFSIVFFFTPLEPEAPYLLEKRRLPEVCVSDVQKCSATRVQIANTVQEHVKDLALALRCPEETNFKRYYLGGK